jgi:hypothetical protein
MANKNPARDPVVEKLDALLSATQDLFILQALLAGINAHDVRKILRVSLNRVSNISRHLKDSRGN